MIQWTLVTGGAKGLGAEICKALAERGSSVLIHYRASEEAAEHVAVACRRCGVHAETIQGDFSTPETTDAFIHTCLSRFSHIKHLVNNVGNYLIKSAAQTTSNEWNALFQTNLHAPFALCRAFLPFITAVQGSILNIGVAGASTIHADTKRTAYLATKMGLWMLTKSLARELAPSQVRVNMISPGYMEHTVDLPADMQTLPMRRPATFQDVISAVAFLFDERNRYITGQNIEISGGIGL